MKKSEFHLVAAIAVVALVVYPFVWLYEHLGWGGIASIAALVVGAVGWNSVESGKRARKEFNELVLYVLKNRLNPNESHTMNRELAKKDFARSALIRRLQILKDSIEIALSSKKRDTAESRMELVRESCQAIHTEHASLITPHTLKEMDRVVEGCETEFYTKLYENVATGHIEKAEKLKTKKSKQKYLGLAKQVVLEGLEKSNSDKEVLGKLKSRIDGRYETINEDS